MRTLRLFIVLASIGASLLSGCKSGPSPEARVRELDEDTQTEKKQADFRKSLPPVQNPGQGQ
jgi:hypothetical protein